MFFLLRGKNGVSVTSFSSVHASGLGRRVGVQVRWDGGGGEVCVGEAS